MGSPQKAHVSPSVNINPSTEHYTVASLYSGTPYCAVQSVLRYADIYSFREVFYWKRDLIVARDAGWFIKTQRNFLLRPAYPSEKKESARNVVLVERIKPIRSPIRRGLSHIRYTRFFFRWKGPPSRFADLANDDIRLAELAARFRSGQVISH